MVDHNTEKRNGLNFARLLVEVEMRAQLPDEVKFKNEKAKVIEQPMQYDWKPTLCRFCKKYRHVEEEWRVKRKVQNPDQVPRMERLVGDHTKQRQYTTNLENYYNIRIWLTWRHNYYQVNPISKTTQQITCEVMFLPLQIAFEISYVYVFNSREDRKELWESLLIQSRRCSKPWMVLGCFNSILKANDRIGGNHESWSEIVDFNECVTNCGLLEFPTQGNRYT
ncbi:hypothetical protein R3W88_016736 [Solanum pinnatisectum]|uniref:Uncharacterized protein n=1 Tax=Solanum pinnatisectum TaxID=50273 RepID=A0AAV9KZ00_9SOLN|nr:hypothetical protein R3W88_016736 [Solanum pinnatisectum]